MGARVCDEHGLYLVSPEALAKLDEAPLLGQVLDAKYALIDLLGGGGYGSVYRGLQQPLGREVAVKILHGLALSMKIGRERFEREAVALARLSSPHTVRLIDFGVTQSGPVGVRNLPYMVMEVIEGEDLERRVRRGRLSPDEVLDVLDGVADSLAEAHAAGIVHRDLKPSNVLLTRSHTGRSLPKVIDFGIARVEGSNKSQTGFVTGTPSYMAPEQVRGESDPDARVDVYALAAMTYELLAGRPPYSGNDAVAILTQHCVAPVATLRGVVSDPALWIFDAPLAAGMAKDRGDRPATVTALVEALRAAWASRDAPAAPPANSPNRTMGYSSPPLSAPEDDAPTAVHIPTPLTLSNLPGEHAVSAPTAPERPSRRLVGWLGGAAAVGTVAVGLGLWAARPEPAPAPAVAVAQPAAVTPTAPPTLPATQPPSLAPTEPPTPTSAASAPAVVARPRPAAPPAAPTRPVARPEPEDRPPPAVDDTAARRKAADLDRALLDCRCLPAKRLLDDLIALPYATPHVAARRARVAACRNVDVDHKCVNGQLVEVE